MDSDSAKICPNPTNLSESRLVDLRVRKDEGYGEGGGKSHCSKDQEDLLPWFGVQFVTETDFSIVLEKISVFPLRSKIWRISKMGFSLPCDYMFPLQMAIISSSNGTLRSLLISSSSQCTQLPVLGPENPWKKPGMPWKTTMSNGKSMEYYWYINELNGSKWV